MATISSTSSTGLSSIEQLVQQSIAASYEQEQITQLENSKSTLNSQISIYTTLSPEVLDTREKLQLTFQRFVR